MIENQELILLDEEGLLSKVYNFAAEGYRIVQIHCTRLDDGFEMNYSFDKDYKFINLRMVIEKDREISSISGIYWSAFLYENEIADLFGVKIKNMVIDYKGSFYQSSVKAPFAVPKPASEKKE
jgi:ech hydrogenase subunit D